MKIEIRITAPCATGKSTVAHTLKRALHRLGFVDVHLHDVDGRDRAMPLQNRQLDAEVHIYEQQAGRVLSRELS